MIRNDRLRWEQFLLLTALFLLGFAAPAKADSLEISVQSTVTASAGSSGNQFDVVLTNLGTAPVSIAAFTFELSSSSSDIIFTGVNTSTVSGAYIFAGNSLFGPDITVSNTGQDVSASDAGSGVTLAPGQTLGLGDILFNVSSRAPTETANLTLAGFPATSLSDEFGNNLTISTLTDSQINVLGKSTVVPEPGSLLLLSTGLVGIALRRLRRRSDI